MKLSNSVFIIVYFSPLLFILCFSSKNTLIRVGIDLVVFLEHSATRYQYTMIITLLLRGKFHLFTMALP